MKQFFTLLTITYLVAISATVFAQPGTLDNTFGSNGTLTSNTFSYGAEDLAIQTNGKFILTGRIGTKLGVTRLRTNGTPDPTFAQDGSFELNITGETRGFSIAIQPDNKILVAGTYDLGVIYTIGIVVIRLKTNGTLDSSFGVNGVTTLPPGKSKLPLKVAMARQQDGAIVLATTEDLEDGAEFSDYNIDVFRLNSDGSTDSTFGTDGKIALNSTAVIELANNIGLLPDGRIIVAGESVLRNQYIFDAALYCFKTNGTFDSSFGINGIAKFDISPFSDDFIYSMLIKSDNKIIVSGQADDDAFMLSVKGNGIVDSSFGTNGIVLKDFGFEGASIRAVIKSQQEDLIIAAGQVYQQGRSDFLVSRFTEDGKLDSSFGTNGFTSTAFTLVNSRIKAAALQSDGKIITAGKTETTFYDNQPGDIAMARYNNDVVLPVTLQNFSANKSGNTVILNWQTKTEQNSNYFSVQGSSDGNNFGEIGSVKSKGSSNQLQQYNFTDANPKKGINYYRLKQVDADGRFTYSSIVQIDFSKIPGIKIAPNPVQNILTVKGLGTAKNLSVIDAAGTVRLKAVSENDIYNRNIQELKPGVYYLIVEENGKRIDAIKFVKQ